MEPSPNHANNRQRCNPMSISFLIHAGNSNSHTINVKSGDKVDILPNTSQVQQYYNNPLSSATTANPRTVKSRTGEDDNQTALKLSRAEKKRLWRKKMSLEKRKQIQEEDAKRKRLKRQSLSEAERIILRKRDAARKAESRKREKSSQNSVVHSGYSRYSSISRKADEWAPDKFGDEKKETVELEPKGSPISDVNENYVPIED